MNRLLLQRYAVAALPSGLALPVGALWAQQNKVAYALFLATIIMASWYGGVGPGLVGSAIGLLAGTQIFIDGPAHWLAGSAPRQGLWIGIVFAIAAVISVLHAALHRAWRRADEAEHQLREHADSARQALNKAEISEDTLRTMIDASPLCVIGYDRNGTVTSWNPGATRAFGWTEEEVLGLPNPALPTSEREAFMDTLHRVRQGEVVMQEVQRRAKDGTWLEMAITAFPSHTAGGDSDSVVILAQDITARRQAEEAIRYQALHDSLTSLPNRSLLQDRLQQAIVTTRRTKTPFALLLMDLDRFKEINDSCGHHYGDLVLQEVAARSLGVLRESDTAARLGGDEFALLLPGTDLVGATLVAAKLLLALERSLVVEEQAIDIEASVGIAMYPQHGDDFTSLLRSADVAMYAAKSTNAGFTVYAPEQNRYSQSRLALTADLRRAIEHNELLLHCQPKVSFHTGRIEGVEALLRWPHPEMGWIQPDDFIPLAEQTGLIRQLNSWSLRAAIRQSRVWQDAGVDVSVAMNLSARTLHDPQLVSMIESMLRKSAVSPPWLTVEITESAVMTDPERARETITQLHDMGMRISIDDFGTGYSSLAYLARLPVDEIKVDRSFVLEMARDESSLAIVRSTIRLGHDLGLRVVAEGIEDEETWELLTEMGCDLGQGFLLGRPAAAEDLISLLSQASA